MELEIYQTIPYENVNVNFTEDAYVNITPIAKHFGKVPKDYLKIQRTQEYISALAQKLSEGNNLLSEENLVISVKGGDPSTQGTWLHPKLVVDFARWLRPEFALWCDERIENILKQKNQNFQMPTNLLEAGKLWIAEMEAHQETRLLLTDAREYIEEAKPKVSYFDVVLACNTLMTVTEISQDYGISAQRLNKILQELGIQYRPKGKGKPWHLHVKYGSKGLAQTVTHTFDGSDGTKRSSLTLKWTQKGRLFIYDLLKAEGILPICEQEDYVPLPEKI